MNFIEILQINVLYLQAFNKSYCLWIKYSYQHQENKPLITQGKLNQTYMSKFKMES